MYYVKPIGVIRSPYKKLDEAPHQGRFSNEICEIHVFEEFSEGLRDVETYSHLIVLYWLHLANRGNLLAISSHNKKERGVFATRSPNRPNPIGFAVVELIERAGNVLRIRWLDAIDGTPVIDIKPYSPELDCVENAKKEKRDLQHWE